MTLGSLKKPAVVLVGAVIAIGVLYLLGRGLATIGDQSVALPLLAIAGVVLLLGAVGAVSIAFASYDLQDRTQALALPEGSIRAIIAMSLIILFAVLSVHLFVTLGNTGTVHTLRDLTEAQRSEFLRNMPAAQVLVTTETQAAPEVKNNDGTVATPARPATYTILYRDPPNQARDDFAKQILVLLGTLMTAACSFYFASRATAGPAAPGGAGAFGPPVVSAVDRATLPAGSAEPIKLSGQRLMLVGALRAVQGNQAVPATDVRSSADSVTATIAFPTGSTGKWDLVVSDAAGREATLRQAVTVT